MSQLLHVFNRYLFHGGEEHIIEIMHKQLAQHHGIERCWFDSREWREPGAPSALGQAWRLFYNPSSRARFEAAVDDHRPDVAIFHNLYPVASPALYRAAQQRNLPVIQFLHNFRPFSVGGTVYARGQILAEALSGNYWREIRYGVWQDSVAKSAIFALLLKALHASGWLRSVRAWVAISDFMRDRFIEAGVPAERIHTLRHFWQAMPEVPPTEDAGYYLFLARLVEVKGVEPLLHAWDKLREQLGERTPALHIGGEGALAETVQSRAASNPSIRYLGLVSGEQKHIALRQCRALMVPSTWWEPLGLVTYEAYDFAKPVLAARSGGLTETVQHGITGRLHEPGNVDNIVRDVLAMEALTSDQRATMGRAGREWLLRETSVETWQKGFDKILASALAK